MASLRSTSMRAGWIVIGVTTTSLLFSAGMRSMFGVLIPSLDAEFGWGRATLGSIAAVGLFLYGAVGPLAGRLADRWSVRWVLVISLTVLGVTTILASRAHSLLTVLLTLGVFSAIGAGGAGLPTATALAARWFVERRGFAIGVLSAGMSAGQILLIPLAMYVVVHYGWRSSLALLALLGLAVIVPLIAFFVRDHPARAIENGVTAAAPSVFGMPTSSAIRELPFWLLAGSFFVCGFTSTGLILTHFIPDCLDRGFSPQMAAGALAVMGGLNIVGTLGAGWICDRFGRTVPLAIFYAFRGVALISLIFVHEPIGLFLFAAGFGLNYIATVPPTSSLVTRIFGARSAGELYGWIFVSHQVGAALGSWVGGVFYQAMHTYTLAYVAAAVLAFLAAAMVLAIRDVPRFREGPASLQPIPIAV